MSRASLHGCITASLKQVEREVRQLVWANNASCKLNYSKFLSCTKVFFHTFFPKTPNPLIFITNLTNWSNIFRVQIDFKPLLHHLNQWRQ